jgi:hypothetical protein
MLRSDISRKYHGRFDMYYVRGTLEECWEWVGGTNGYGYGAFKLNKRMEHAHRIAYIIQFGDFDQNLHVLHTCDNPPCVNPNHLFLGTQKDNMLDMISKGRNSVIGIRK